MNPYIIKKIFNLFVLAIVLATYNPTASFAGGYEESDLLDDIASSLIDSNEEAPVVDDGHGHAPGETCSSQETAAEVEEDAEEEHSNEEAPVVDDGHGHAPGETCSSQETAAEVEEDHSGHDHAKTEEEHADEATPVVDDGHGHAPGETCSSQETAEVTPAAEEDHSGHDHAKTEEVAAPVVDDGHGHAPGETCSSQETAEAEVEEDHSGHAHESEAEEEHADEEDHSGHDHAKTEEVAAPVVDDGHGHAPGETCSSQENAEVTPAAEEDHSGHDHAKTEKVAAPVVDDGHGHAPGETCTGTGAAIPFSAAQISEAGIKIQKVDSGVIDNSASFTGVIALNQDKVAQIVPRISGTVKAVKKTLGDKVKKGDVLAVLDSREFAASKAVYMTSMELLTLEKAIFNQHKKMFGKQISSETEYLKAKKAYAQALIASRAARQKLAALGLTTNAIAELSSDDVTDFTSFNVVAPIAGEIIERDITLGQTIKDDDDSARFCIADLSDVWVDLNIYQSDLASVKVGKKVLVDFGDNVPKAIGVISYVSPVIDAKTRTASAVAVIENPNGFYRPGIFIKASIILNSAKVKTRVLREAVQTMDDETVVFVKTGDGFSPQVVKIGNIDRQYVEIKSGLSANQQYAAEGSFALKAHMLTSNMDPHAGHGH